MDTDRFDDQAQTDQPSRMDERRERWEYRQEARRARWENRMARGRHHSPASGILFGVIIVLLGCLLLLDNLGFVRLDDLWKYWPVLLIVLGVSVLLRGLRRNRVRTNSSSCMSPLVDTRAFFSDNKSATDTQEFNGGEATAVFGAARFDLRNASMTVDEARIDVNVVFGEVEVRVPETWNAISRASVVFAGVNDKTIHPRTDPNIKTPRLVITGDVVFGSITLRN